VIVWIWDAEGPAGRSAASSTSPPPKPAPGGVNGTCRLTTAHPDTPPDIDLSPFAPLIASLTLPFVTADLARRTDGTWRLIELGDGQVSDRPDTTSGDSFLAAILPRS
jgi:hypothetical protein